jgi:hypothetical protein
MAALTSLTGENSVQRSSSWARFLKKKETNFNFTTLLKSHSATIHKNNMTTEKAEEGNEEFFIMSNFIICTCQKLFSVFN